MNFATEQRFACLGVGRGKKTEYWNAVLVPVNPPSLQLQQQLQWKLQAQVLASITHNNSCCLFASCTVLK